MHSLVIPSAFVLDLIFGDPLWFPHPVRFIGRMIRLAENSLRTFARSPRAEKISGVLLVLIIVPPVYFLTRFLISSASSISVALGFMVSVVTAYTTLAARSLAEAARLVLSRLDEGDIVTARKKLSMIVGRDTGSLDEQEIDAGRERLIAHYCRMKDLGTVLEARPNTLKPEAQNGYFAGGHGDFSVILDQEQRYFYFLFDNYSGPLEHQGVAVARMAFEDRANITTETQGDIRRAVDSALRLLDSGKLRVAFIGGSTAKN